MEAETIEKSQGATRYDEGKVRIELVPPDFIEEVAWVFTEGAKKYGDGNWQKGMKWSRVIGSTFRHLLAIIRGEDYDKESGRLHAAHVASNMALLITYKRTHPELDDRLFKE